MTLKRFLRNSSQVLITNVKLNKMAKRLQEAYWILYAIQSLIFSTFVLYIFRPDNHQSKSNLRKVSYNLSPHEMWSIE